jgi:PAS domain S-box-containing protein
MSGTLRSWNFPVRVKLLLAFSTVIIVPSLLLFVLSTLTVNRKIEDQVVEGIRNEFDVLWQEYLQTGKEMQIPMLIQAQRTTFQAALANRDKAFLKDYFKRWNHVQPFIDVMIAVDPSGTVIARLNGDLSGDVLPLKLMSDVLATRSPVVSTEIFPAELIQKEGSEIENRSTVEGISLQPGRDYPRGTLQERNAMAQVAAFPVAGEDGRLLGGILAVEILNREDYLPNLFRERIPSSSVSFGLDGMVVATNAKGPNGQSAIGTLLPAELMEVLKRGESFGKWENFFGEKELTFYHPISDSADKVIGALILQFPQKNLLSLESENRRNIAFITLLGMVLALAIAFLHSRQLTGNLKILTKGAQSLTEGNLDTRILIETKAPPRDGLILLGKNFNQMAGSIKRHMEEREHHVRAMEESNRTLRQLNEELQVSKEELEIAYEEAQTQREELQSANEEMTILTEDLERRTQELAEANRRLTEEERELTEVKSELQSIFDGIQDYILLLNPSGQILRANRAALRAFGVTPESIVDRNYEELLFQNGPPPSSTAIKQTLQTRTSSFSEHTAPEGRSYEVQAFPILDAGQTLTHIVAYIKDVTQQKKMLQQVMQNEKLAALGETLAGIAHELNNPLTGVIGYPELLLVAPSSEETREKLRTLHKETLRCYKIAQNLLSFARAYRIEREVVNVNHLLNSTIELVINQMRLDNIEVRWDLQEDLPFTVADPTKISQVFLNIANNAYQAMHSMARQGILTIRTRLVDRTIQVLFSDNGPGISPEFLTRIFDPFFTTKAVGKGTGLGLSISHGIISEHEGRIWVDSQPGQGATFTIELPVVAPKAPTSPSSTPTSVDVSPKRILVVDDEEMILDLMKMVLEEEGHRVDVARNGTSALQAARQTEYDLIFSDIRMPDLNGQELYNALRNFNPAYAKRVIFSTGDLAQKESNDFLQETGNLYLTKPFRIGDVIQIVQNFFMKERRENPWQNR